MLRNNRKKLRIGAAGRAHFPPAFFPPPTLGGAPLPALRAAGRGRS